MFHSSVLQLIQHPNVSLGYLLMLNNCNNIYLAHIYKTNIYDYDNIPVQFIREVF